MKNYRRLLAFIMSIVCIVSFAGCDVLLLTDDTASSPSKVTGSNGFNIHMIDIGQGDSILLECDGSYMLIDAGENDKGGVVVDYLKKHNISKLDYALITHPHSDHYGGFKTVFESVEPESIVMTEAMNTTRTWEKLVDYIDNKKYNVIFPKTNDTINLGSSKLTMYVPKVTDSLNNCSIIVRAEYNGMSALFTGDAEKSEEKDILNAGFDVSANVLKMGHHGSSTSTSDKFLSAVNPDIALISCGKNNDYGHPHKETVAKLNKNNIPMFRTDVYGSITVTLKNNTISLNTDNGYTENIAIGANKKNSVSDSSKSSSSKSSSSKSSSVKKTEKYVGNKNTHVFHSADCASVGKMSDSNKVYFKSYDEAIGQGYTPAKDCNP